MARDGVMRKNLPILLRMIFCALLIVTAHANLWAQSTALLTGTVTDPSGGVIPGAKVVCQNSQTGLLYNATTNSEGLFRFPELPVGRYQLQIEANGFEKLVRSGIVLMTGHSVDLTVPLKVGSSVQTVSVKSGYQVVQPTSSDLQTTIDSQGMTNLPLNGRNPLQLVILTPGAIDTQGQNGGSLSFQSANDQVAVNGNRGTDNSYELDGASYTDVHYGTAPILPNPDALEEFSVKASNFSASQPGAGASVQFTTRSGTNQIHGSAFNFLRNNAFDARNYFSPTVTPFKRNQFGGSVGGPIIKNKLFFFVAYQGTRAIGGASPSVATPPATALRDGDFASTGNTIIDPDTKAPFPDNTIPTSRFDALAVNFLPYIPLPNQANGTYISSPRDNQDEDQIIGKLDYSLSAKDHLTGRYFFDNFSFQIPSSSFPNIYGLDTFHNRNILLSETHTFNPTFVVVAAFSYTRVPRLQSGVLPTTAQALGAQVSPSVVNPIPELSVTVDDYASLVSSAPVNFQPSTLNWRVDFTKSHGKHMLQFGMDVFRDHEIDWVESNSLGAWTFDGSRTTSAAVSKSGNPFADFLLGLPEEFTQYGTSTPAVNLYQMRFGPWIQDDWRISPRLTLNLGLRWDPWLPARDSEGPQPAFEPGVQSTVAPGAPLGLLFSGDPGLQPTIFPKDWYNLAPRVGFAWDVTGNQLNVIRGAYGIFYRPVPMNNERFSSDDAAFRSLTATLSDPPSFANPYMNTTSPFPFVPLNSSELKTYVFPNPVTAAALDPHSATSYVQEWNLTAERQIGADLGVSVSYVGNVMRHGMDATEGNPALYEPGATEANANSRRPYAGIASLEILEPFAFSNYNSMQLTITKRASHGLTLLGNYVYSKCMDNNSNTTGTVSVINKLDPNKDYAVCDFNVTHAANLSLMYYVPGVTSIHGLADKLLNHWALTSIVTASTGFPFDVYSGIDNALSGPTTNSEYSSNDLADLVPGVSRAQPAGVSAIKEWFNTAAYVTNALGTYGDSGRNSLTTADSWIWDFGVHKTFPVTKRAQIEFRFESFNFLNHTNFDAPEATLTSSEFGEILSAGDPRVNQFALRVSF